MIRLIGHLLRLILGRLAGRKPAARQVAALPIRRGANGQIEVCLISSRRSGRLLVPRGWPMAGKPDHRAAAIEAEEEAGLVGDIYTVPIGTYRYRKGRRPRTPIEVDVYVLRVTSRLRRWREKGQREVVWLELSDAASAVDDPGLAALIGHVPRHLAPVPPERERART